MMQRFFVSCALIFYLMPLRPVAAAGLAELLFSCAPPARRMERVELAFGLSIKGSGRVSERAFRHFLAVEITPRFPDGLTIVPANGQWRDREGRIVREGARLVIIYAPDSDGLRERMAQIITAYRERFRQDSVLVAQSSACVSF